MTRVTTPHHHTDVFMNVPVISMWSAGELRGERRRAWTATGGVTNWHVYAGIHCIADVDDSGNLLRTYTWGPGIDNLLAITVHGATETNTYYALTDHLGTVHALANESGTIVESYMYDAWGNLLGVYDSADQPLTSSTIG
ncbi:MAG: hypothetical protein K9N51_11020, partial [Candidatus Pacebacteria bacterium]|nr:hypothetical protein [Candidatus Paceibacterota bacterium]